MSARMQGGFKGGGKLQGGWVQFAVAAAAKIGELVAGAKGASAASSAERAQSKAIKADWKETYRSMRKEELATLGTQTAAYAGSGVDVGVGSASKVLAETRDEFHRAVAADAYLTQQRLKGASAEGKAVQYQQVGNYFSGIASLSQDVYGIGKEKGWFG